jgi:hypothetical protein
MCGSIERLLRASDPGVPAEEGQQWLAVVARHVE